MLTPRGTLYRPVLGTGPLLPVDGKTVYKSPSTELGLDLTATRTASGNNFVTRTGSVIDTAVPIGLGALGPASAFIPALALPVASVGLGYGLYKAGQALKIW